MCFHVHTVKIARENYMYKKQNFMRDSNVKEGSLRSFIKQNMLENAISAIQWFPHTFLKYFRDAKWFFRVYIKKIVFLLLLCVFFTYGQAQWGQQISLLPIWT